MTALCILSIDGGGILGLIAALVLAEIIAAQEGVQWPEVG